MSKWSSSLPAERKLFFNLLSRRYQDPGVTNCCSDPTANAAILRGLAQVQGILIGPYPNRTILDSLTGSSSLDANALLSGNPQLDGASIAQQLFSFLDNAQAAATCAPVPAVGPQCQEIVDVVLILHAQNEANWNTIRNFVAKSYLPVLFGGLSTSQLSVYSSVNLAILSYSATQVRYVRALPFRVFR